MLKKRKTKNLFFEKILVLDKYKNLFDFKLFKMTLFYTSLFTVLANGIGIFNKYSVFDDINLLFAGGVTFQYGRFGLGILHKLFMLILGDNINSLPVFNSIFAILFLTLSSYIIIKIFEIKSIISIILISGFLSVFPVVTAYYGYMFTLHYYTLAIFLSIFSVYFFIKNVDIISYIFGIFFLISGISIYQAVLPISLSLIILYDMIFLWRTASDDKNKKIINLCIKKIITQSIAVLFSVVIYILLAHFFSYISGYGIWSNRGINSMGQLPIVVYLNRCVEAYKEFFYPKSVVSGFYLYNNQFVFYMVLVVCFYIILAYNAIKIFKNGLFIFMFYVFLVLLFPVCINFIYVMADPKEVYSMMRYGSVVFFISTVILIEVFLYLHSFKYIVNLLLIAILVLFIRFDNQCYLRAELQQKQTINYFNNIITRIKSTEGYNDEMPICYVNQNHIVDKTVCDIKQFSSIDFNPYGDMNFYLNNYAWRHFMWRWCGFHPNEINEQKFNNIPEVVNMPMFPDDGSIKIVDNVVIVKF